MEHLPPQLCNLAKKVKIWDRVSLVLFVVAFAGNFVPESWVMIPFIAFFLFFPAYAYTRRITIKLKLEMRRYEAKDIKSPEEGLVLYLRAFDDDLISAKLSGRITEEEHLAGVLNKIGTFVAIGRPSETLPEVGAQRLYVDHANWQKKVENLMGVANLVVIRTGRSTGLQWEIQRAATLLDPEKLVLLVDSKEEFLPVINDILRSHSVKLVKPRLGWCTIGSIRGFVVFDKSWYPSIIKARSWLSCFLLYKPQNDSFAEARLLLTLRPVFDRAGVEWSGPSWHVGKIVYWVLYIALLSMFFIV